MGMGEIGSMGGSWEMKAPWEKEVKRGVRTGEGWVGLSLWTPTGETRFYMDPLKIPSGSVCKYLEKLQDFVKIAFSGLNDFLGICLEHC